MLLVRLTEKNIMLLDEIVKRGGISSREQHIYSLFAFYVNIGTLKRLGLIAEKTGNGNNKKFWYATERGIKLLYHIKKAEEVLKDGEKSFLAVKGEQSC